MKGRNWLAFHLPSAGPAPPTRNEWGPWPEAPRPGAEAAGCTPLGGQAEPKMLISPARTRPGLGLPLASLFRLLLLAVLSSPVSGRVPRSVPRTSLPSSGKVRAPSPSALRATPRPCLQVPAPTFPPDPGSSTRAPQLRARRPAPPTPCPDPGGTPQRGCCTASRARPSRLGSHDTPRRLLRPFIVRTAGELSHWSCRCRP